jgi:hypothetical protein
MNKDLYHESVQPAPQYLQCCGKFQVIIERKRTYSHCENESGSFKSLCSLPRSAEFAMLRLVLSDF